MKHQLYVAAFVLITAYCALFELEEKEWDRMSAPVAHSNVPGIRVDAPMLDIDTAMFVSNPLASREVGSPGSKLAQDYIAKRFAQLRLQAFGHGYAMPFSFHRTQIGGLFKNGQSFREDFPSATNMVGFIRGSEHPERYIVVSARYDTHVEAGFLETDHWKTNESGLATMLGMASYFMQHPPRNSIVFAAFDAEERGQAGAQAFMSNLPVVKSQIAVNLNLDVVGSFHSHYFFIAGTRHTRALTPLVELAALSCLQPVGIGHDRPFWKAGRIEDWTGASDHRVFHEEGIPFLFASIEETDDGGPVPGKPPYAAWHFENAANFLTTLAVKLDQNLDALPPSK